MKTPDNLHRTATYAHIKYREPFKRKYVKCVFWYLCSEKLYMRSHTGTELEISIHFTVLSDSGTAC